MVGVTERAAEQLKTVIQRYEEQESKSGLALRVYVSGKCGCGAIHYGLGIDDKTGEVKSMIVIADNGGVLKGRVDKLLRKDADQKAVCKECSDDRKDKPLLGLEIIRGAKQVEGKEVWEGGKILDPENGKEYTLRLTPVEGGKKLEVRGSIAFFGRTQTWVRVL